MTMPHDCTRMQAEEDVSFTVRRMEVSDVPQVLEIWKSIGLHEGTQTIQSFMAVDPQGFAVAQDSKDPDLILGMCAGVFVSSTGFVGLYAVRPDFQGKGIGIRIFHRIMGHINGRNAGLYAVPEQLVKYRDRSGFCHEDSVRMQVYESDSVRLEDLVKEIGNVDVQSIDLEDDEKRFRDICLYDESVTRVDRSLLLKETFKEADSVALVALETEQRVVGSPRSLATADSRVLGYICIRTNNVGKGMVGPLYADNDAVAELLLFKGISKLEAAKNGLLFMSLDANPGGDRIAMKMALKPQEESLPRFFTKFIPEADLRRIYCIHSPNFSPF